MPRLRVDPLVRSHVRRHLHAVGGVVLCRRPPATPRAGTPRQAKGSAQVPNRRLQGGGGGPPEANLHLLGSMGGHPTPLQVGHQQLGRHVAPVHAQLWAQLRHPRRQVVSHALAAHVGVVLPPALGPRHAALHRLQHARQAGGRSGDARVPHRHRPGGPPAGRRGQPRQRRRRGGPQRGSPAGGWQRGHAHHWRRAHTQASPTSWGCEWPPRAPRVPRRAPRHHPGCCQGCRCRWCQEATRPGVPHVRRLQPRVTQGGSVLAGLRDSCQLV
jgi:hypothetical protein